MSFPPFDPTPGPEPLPRVMTQRWTRLTFLHWPYDPADVAPLLPAGTRPELPYIWSAMKLRQTGDELLYLTRRRVSGIRCRLRIRIGGPVAPEPLDDFHSARWGLHSRWYGTASYVPITHGRWPLRAAELLELDDGLVAATGPPAPVGEPRVLYSDGVEVHLGRPQRL